MIRIFEDDDAPEVILGHVLEHGIAGIAGGRMVTRRALARVRELAEKNRHPEVIAVFTVDHFWGELAVIYDDKLYHLHEARDLVVEAYDRQLGEQGVFPDTYPGAE